MVCWKSPTVNRRTTWLCPLCRLRIATLNQPTSRGEILLKGEDVEVRHNYLDQEVGGRLEHHLNCLVVSQPVPFSIGFTQLATFLIPSYCTGWPCFVNLQLFSIWVETSSTDWKTIRCDPLSHGLQIFQQGLPQIKPIITMVHNPGLHFYIYIPIICYMVRQKSTRLNCHVDVEGHGWVHILCIYVHTETAWM